MSELRIIIESINYYVSKQVILYIYIIKRISGAITALLQFPENEKSKPLWFALL